MPSYKYECPYCGATAYETRPIEKRNDPLPCGCGCKVSMIRVYQMPYVSASARPTSRRETADALERERRWQPDMDAYKRLRADGVQPRSVAGSARLERDANTTTELRMGKVMPLKDVKDGVGLSSEMLGKELDL